MRLHYITQRRQLVRSYYSGIGKTAVIFPSAFLVAVAEGMIMLGMVFYMKEVLKASPSQIGVLVSVWTICYFLGCIFLRPLIERILPRYSMILAVLVTTAATACMPLVRSLLPVYVLYGVFGLAISMFWPSAMAWLSRGKEGPGLSRTISHFNLSWCSGLVISPYIGAWLSERSPELPLYAGSITFLGLLIMLIGAALVLPRVRTDRIAGGRDKEEEDAGGGKRSPLRHPARVGVYAAFFVAGVLGAIFPVFAREELMFSKSTIGLLLAARMLGMATGFSVLGRTTFWHFKKAPMLLAQVSLGMLVLCMVYSRSAGIFAPLFAFNGLASAMSYSSSMFHSISGSRSRAAAMAVHEAFLSAGVAAGPITCGLLYERYSMTVVWFFLLAVVGASVLVQAALCISKTR